MSNQVALYLQDSVSLQESLALVRYAEARGFEAVWQAESHLARDIAVVMSAYLTSTRRIHIGSAVMNHWTRNIAVLAGTFWTLDTLAPERVLCGLGSWWEPIATQVGVRRRKNLLAMRETVTVLRRLFKGERVSYRSEFVNLDSVALASSGRHIPKHMPIYLGATGPKMLALAGEIADGVILNSFVSPAYNEMAMNQIEIGAKQAGHSAYNLRRPQLIACSVDEDSQKAIQVARKAVTRHIWQQPQLMRANGVSQDLLDEIAQVMSVGSTDEQLFEAMKLVPDEVVQLLTASGNPKDVRAKVRDYIQSGASSPILHSLGDDVRFMIDTFANGYSN